MSESNSFKEISFQVHVPGWDGLDVFDDNCHFVLGRAVEMAAKDRLSCWVLSPVDKCRDFGIPSKEFPGRRLLARVKFGAEGRALVELVQPQEAS